MRRSCGRPGKNRAVTDRGAFAIRRLDAFPLRRCLHACLAIPRSSGKFLLSLFLGLVAVSEAPAQPEWRFSCATEAEWKPIDVGETPVRLAFDAGANHAALLLIEERGQDLEWAAGSAGFAAIDSRPPRLGMLALPVERFRSVRLRKATRATTVAHARIRLVCQPDDGIAQLPTCIDRARGLLAGDSVSESVETLPENACGALLAHAAATRASRQSQPAQSLEFYEQAARLWTEAGDAPRSATAVLGAAEQLLRLGRFGDAVERAGAAVELNRAAGNEYFALRAESERCLAQSELEGGTSTFECMRGLPPAFEALGEINEAANTGFNLAEMAADDGDVDAQRAALAAAARLDPSFVDPVVHGRLRFSQSALAISEGRIGAAIEALDDALHSFEAAGDERWQANAQLAVASLYSQLGAPREALLLVEEALSHLSEEQAPQRLAVALRLRARLHAAQGEIDAARADIARAGELFERLHMPLAVAETVLDEQEWGIGAAHAAIETLPAATTLPPRLAFRAGWLQARDALAQGHLAEVDAFLAGTREERLALFDRFDVRALEARRAMSGGNAAGAQRSVERSIQWLREVVATARAPALRRILMRRLGDLRGLWLEAWSAQPAASRPGLPQLWAMLGRTHASAALAAEAETGAASAGSSAFDRRLAQQLLRSEDGEGGPAEASAQRRLLGKYARDQETITGAAQLPALPPLPELQHALPDDAMLLAFALGERRGFALALSKTAATIHPIDSPASIRAAVRRLFDVLDGPARPTAEIGLAARDVGEALLPAGVPLPQRLLVLADDELAAVPYSLLPWPGQASPLVDTTDVSVVTLPLASAAPVAVSDESGFDVLIASAGSDAGPLPALPVAGREAALIQHARPRSRVEVRHGIALDRAALMQALRRTGARVHVAAHGFRQPGLEGYAGIWLQGGVAPELVSWLDFAGSRLGAQLAVLDVCQLAAQTDLVSAGTSSFAGALSAAGVANVVAASWPISDAAAALWVPEFYSGLHSAGAGDVAHALRAAQLRLRDSRMFRHPYYWASLVHLQRGIEAQ